MGTLISMLNQGFGTRRQGFEARALTGLGLGPPSAIMQTEVATTKPKRKLRCFDATRLIAVRTAHRKSIGATSRRCQDRVRTNTAWVGSKGPQRLGARAPRGLGPRLPAACCYYASLSCKGKKRTFSPSPLLKPSNTPPKVGGGFTVSYD